MALSALKTWIGGEVLTASDQNSEFSNIYSNGEDLAWPATKAKDFDGNELILDADGDTSITADTDDQMDFKCGGSDVFTLTATNISGSSIKDEDDMSSDSAVHLATQQSIKAYVDSAFATGSQPFTVAGVSDGTPVNVAHGLGTDDIDFGFTFAQTAGIVAALINFSVTVMDTNGYHSFLHGPSFQLPADPILNTDAPSAGNLRMNVRNGSVNTIDLTIRWWARKR